MKKEHQRRISSSLLVCMLLAQSASAVSCAVSADAKNHTYEDFDVRESLGITFSSASLDFVELSAGPAEGEAAVPNTVSDEPQTFRMTVIDRMSIYSSTTSEYPSNTLYAGEVIQLTEPEEGSEWATVSDLKGNRIGYTKDGFLHAVNEGISMYAELPVEYGLARDNNNNMVEAYSHLVDIRKYMKVYASTDPSNEGVDLSQYDIKVSMKLSTEDTSINKPFYSRNLCLLQYDTLQKLIKAANNFKKLGYMIVIYDAYRPTSVQQRWFDVVKVHKWVADPSRGMGGIHDRGTAVDISLVNIKTGEELEFPTPMHTFTVDSARDSEIMTEAARANMDYMTRIMSACGFTWINSEWWHFQCRDTKNYLPTDHPIDDIPLIPSEQEL